MAAAAAAAAAVAVAVGSVVVVDANDDEDDDEDDVVEGLVRGEEVGGSNFLSVTSAGGAVAVAERVVEVAAFSEALAAAATAATAAAAVAAAAFASVFTGECDVVSGVGSAKQGNGKCTVD